ncbi:MAG: hypothetical protein RDV48_27335 [Candidatus Eremiobacteraeota bacterium]|nr:hypothetical protein [Candidatus Eremiobacteraeota bacterium]
MKGNRKRQRGLSLVVTLLVLVIMTVIVFAIGSRAIVNLNFTTTEKYRTMAFYAAEAGLSNALLNYKKGQSGWDSGIGSAASPVNLFNGASYYVQVTRNETQQDMTAPNGTIVKPGQIHFLGTGNWQNKVAQQQVAIVVKVNQGGAFDYAIATAGDVAFNANTTITGNIKTSGSITNNAVLSVKPYNGEGRVLVTGQIDNGTPHGSSGKWVHSNPDGTPNALNDVRARAGITAPTKVDGWDYLGNPDSTDDTLAFINDGSLAPTSIPGRESLPNPDMTELLASCRTITTNNYSGSLTFNYDGEVVYFPNSSGDPEGIGGIQITSLTGKGTIVVGSYGKPGKLNFSTGGAGTDNVNLIAVDGGTNSNWAGSGTVGGAKIYNRNNTIINGLVYAHGTIKTNAHLEVNGSVISYNTGGVEQNGANSTFNLAPLAVQCPGFEAWIGGSTYGEVVIISWQKM